MEQNKNEEKEIKLPPLPDEAVEFDPLSLESMIDDTDIQEAKLAENEIAAELAEFADLENVSTYTEEIHNALKDLVSGSINDPVIKKINDEGEPIITNDPMPTPVDPEKEFDPSSTQNALDDFDEEGGVRKAVAKGPTMAKLASKEIKVDLGSRTSNYNPGTVQDALQDSSIEGGVVSNKSTGPMKTPGGDSAKDGSQIKGITDKISESNKYRVYGFSVQYLTKNSADEVVIVTKQVNDYFDDLLKAEVSVNGSKYLMPLDNGAFEVVDIVSGTPQISLGDQNLYIYTGGKTGEGGYWKR